MTGRSPPGAVSHHEFYPLGNILGSQLNQPGSAKVSLCHASRIMPCPSAHATPPWFMLHLSTHITLSLVNGHFPSFYTTPPWFMPYFSLLMPYLPWSMPRRSAQTTIPWFMPHLSTHAILSWLMPRPSDYTTPPHFMLHPIGSCHTFLGNAMPPPPMPRLPWFISTPLMGLQIPSLSPPPSNLSGPVSLCKYQPLCRCREILSPTVEWADLGGTNWL